MATVSEIRPNGLRCFYKLFIGGERGLSLFIHSFTLTIPYPLSFLCISFYCSSMICLQFFAHKIPHLYSDSQKKPLTQRMEVSPTLD